MRPTSGAARVFGLDCHADPIAVQQRTGYLPSDFGVYSRRTVWDHLRFWSSLRGRFEENRVNALMERLDLDPSRTASELSTGNMQKLGLVQAFQDDPDLVILDEPTAGSTH